MIEATDVGVVFRGGWRNRRRLRALDGFNLSVERGDIVAVLGPNGSGKSTAMHTLLGLIRPDQGEVRLFGERPLPGSPLHDKVAYLPEEPHYHLYLTVEEAVRYYSALYREQAPESRIQEAIEQVGLSDARRLRLKKCSKGMKQKVGIASCLVHESEVIFLDEPMRGLDPATVKLFRDLLLEMNRRGATILMNSHILSEVEMICTRAAIMQQGRVIREDSIENLKSRDFEHYVVELDAIEPLPDCFRVLEYRTDSVVGRVTPGDMERLFQVATAGGATVRSCTFSQLSLEEAFFAALDEES